MTKENITWRTFDDAGAIRDQWNAPATPAYYLLDHHGVIRHRWMGKPDADTVDKAVAKLVREAEAAK